ncbi:hypothetical protein ABTY96_46840 [Streptomyces sp. NPDC096057]|uniref:hypothetical protein n=1 Tax=Streptomyces sp. NPDC096057 TaxID=3155543 RepID=UPI0033184696
MISEPEMPEMAEECGAQDTREVVGDHAREAAQRAPRRPRPPWVWALGGAVAASALWTAAVGLLDLGGHKPDTLGYRLTHDPCRSMRLPSLETAITPRNADYVTSSGVLRSRPLDQVQCSIPLGTNDQTKSADHWHRNYTVGVTVALHKKVDPGTEFGAQKRVTDLGVVPSVNVRTLAGLGQQAFFIVKDASHCELRVLAGGAVFSISLSVSQYYDDDSGADDAAAFDNPPDLPDPTTFQHAMVSDMRYLMTHIGR